MTKKIIALDLDGTLLRSDNTISDYTVNVIQQIQNKGHKVIIATGRPYRMALEYYHQLKLSTPLISFNGSMTNLPDTSWQWEHSITVDKYYLLEILKMQTDIKADFVASEYRQNFYISATDYHCIDPKLFGVTKITQKMAMDITKITKNPHGLLIQTHHQDKYGLADDMQRHFQHNIEIDSWGGPLNILEVSPKGISKAYALKYLLGVFNISRENLIAFGDEHNDTEMLALSGIGYAMKNASEVLLPYADRQTAYSNEEDGVAKELQNIFL